LFCADALRTDATLAARQRPVPPADRHRDNDGYDSPHLNEFARSYFESHRKK